MYNLEFNNGNDGGELRGGGEGGRFGETEFTTQPFRNDGLDGNANQATETFDVDLSRS